MYISLYVHKTDKNYNKNSTDELYSTVHCVNIPSIFTSCQCWPFHIYFRMCRKGTTHAETRFRVLIPMDKTRNFSFL